jgi:hypothetical protein
LTCETSAGRPAAQIAWIKISKKGIRTDFTKNATFKLLSLDNGLTKVQSSIDLKPQREDNDSRIICQATNYLSNVIENKVTLFVQCKLLRLYACYQLKCCYA